MSAVPCPACHQPMAAAALVCPHCGKRRPDGEVGLAGKGLSKEEVTALIAIHGSDVAPSEGLLPTLIFPHPTTHGAPRAVETICTIIALPMVILGAFSIALSRRRMRQTVDQTVGEAGPVVAMSLFGGLGLYSVLSLAGVGTAASLTVLGISIGALIVRGAIRSHASTKRSRDLHRLAKPEPAPRTSQPKLPAARVEPSRPSGPIVAVAPTVRTAEAPRATTDNPDEPSLLK